jgi:hypothetical protein
MPWALLLLQGSQPMMSHRLCLGEWLITGNRLRYHYRRRRQAQALKRVRCHTRP